MKNIYKLLTVLAICACFTSCEEDLIIYDSVNGQTLVTAPTTSAVVGTPEEGASSTLIVEVSTVSTQDRNISYSVDAESTANPSEYTISGGVIAAGEYTTDLVVTTNFNQLPEEGSSFLTLNIDGVEGDSDAAIADSKLNYEFFRLCPVPMNDGLVGTWSGTGSWGNTSLAYTTEIVTTLDENGNLLMNGIAFQWFQGWWGEVIETNSPVIVDVDPDTGEFVIDEQFYITSSFNGAPQPSYNMKATGRITNTCKKTLEIYPVFVQGGSDIDGTIWGPQFVEEIALD